MRSGLLMAYQSCPATNFRIIPGFLTVGTIGSKSLAGLKYLQGEMHRILTLKKLKLPPKEILLKGMPLDWLFSIRAIKIVISPETTHFLAVIFKPMVSSAIAFLIYCILLITTTKQPEQEFLFTQRVVKL